MVPISGIKLYNIPIKEIKVIVHSKLALHCCISVENKGYLANIIWGTISFASSGVNSIFNNRKYKMTRLINCK